MYGIDVALMNHTQNMKETVYAAYRQCFSRLSAQTILNDALTEDDTVYAEILIRNCIKRGHLSPLEHASFTFSISGCSRACSHQLVRHRLASYSQQSQRYVKMDMKEMPFFIPQSISTICYKDYKEMLNTISGFYDSLIAKGIPKEDARYILPEATRTKIVVTMNLRELLHFFHERLCGKAQDEIREVATAMAELVIRYEPWLAEYIGAKCKGKEKCMDGELNLCSEHYRWRFEDEEAIDVTYEEAKEDDEENPSD